MRPANARRARVLLAALSFLLAATAVAEDKYVKSKDAVFPDVQPAHALVYFARPDFMRLIHSPTLKVFVDSTPIGWLPQRSYLAAQVEPGSHVVWGPMNATQRVDFQAGKTYLLVLVVRYGPNNSLSDAAWELGDPSYVRNIVAEGKLSYVKANDEELAKLKEEGAKKAGKAEQHAPEVHAAALPASFENVWYRATRKITWKGYAAVGTLTVTSDAVEFKSEKENVTIPLKDVQSFALDRFTGLVGSSDESAWNMITFNQAGTPAFAAFRDRSEPASTQRIFLTLQSAVRPSTTSVQQTASAQPAPASVEQSPPDAAPAPSDQPKPNIKTGQIEENQPYKSRQGMFSVTVPPARNPFVRTYKLAESQLKQGTADYEEAAFEISDFGQAYGAGVHRIPASVQDVMAKEDSKLVLSNLADKTVFSWRKYAEEPKPVEESAVQTQFGEGLLRIYVAGHSSILVRVTGTDANGKRVGESADARIAVLVVKKAGNYMHATAEDESPMPGAASLDLRKQLESFFATMTVTEQTASQPAAAAAAPPSPTPSPSQPTPIAQSVPDRFVLYEGSKEQFTIALPRDWTVYDQTQMMKASGLDRMPVRVADMVFFYESIDPAPQAMLSVELMGKIDTGSLPSFFLQRLRADKGMSCSGFSDKAEKKALDLIGKDPEFKGKNAVEAAHAEPADVGGCKGLKIRAKGQRPQGPPLVAEAYVASDGETMYVFSLRNPADTFDKNVDVYHKAISTLRLAAAK